MNKVPDPSAVNEEILMRMDALEAKCEAMNSVFAKQNEAQMSVFAELQDKVIPHLRKSVDDVGAAVKPLPGLWDRIYALERAVSQLRNVLFADVVQMDAVKRLPEDNPMRFNEDMVPGVYRYLGKVHRAMIAFDRSATAILRYLRSEGGTPLDDACEVGFGDDALKALVHRLAEYDLSEEDVAYILTGSKPETGND